MKGYLFRQNDIRKDKGLELGLDLEGVGVWGG